jgi:hypothetical protein
MTCRERLGGQETLVIRCTAGLFERHHPSDMRAAVGNTIWVQLCDYFKELHASLRQCRW